MSVGNEASSERNTLRRPVISKIRDLAMQQPATPAIISAATGVIPRDQLCDTIEALASAAHTAGVSHGDRIGIIVTDNLDFGFWFLAAVQDEFCVVPFSADTPLPTLIRQIRQARCTHLAGPENWIEQVNPKLLGRCEANIISFAGTTRPGNTRVDLVLPAPDAPRPDSAGACLILKTSGTTGDPKLVPISAALLQRSAERVSRDIQLTDSDHGICLMPLLHVHGLVACFLAPLLSGGCVTILKAMDIDGLIDHITDGSATWFSGVPTIHLAVAQRLCAPDCDTTKAQIRVVRSASAPLPHIVREQYKIALEAAVVEAYGMTEAGHQISSQTVSGTSLINSVGKPDPDELRLLQPDTGKSGTSGTGEVILNLGEHFPGYLNVADDSIWHEGWFRTGDLGRIESDGSLVLTGRSKEMINRGGETIAPAEIENALLAVPGIDLACVFAVPHPTVGEAIEAAVVCTEDSTNGAIDDATIRSFLLRVLQANHIPQRIHFLDQLPASESGKINRRALQSMYTPDPEDAHA